MEKSMGKISLQMLLSSGHRDPVSMRLLTLTGEVSDKR